MEQENSDIGRLVCYFIVTQPELSERGIYFLSLL